MGGISAYHTKPGEPTSDSRIVREERTIVPLGALFVASVLDWKEMLCFSYVFSGSNFEFVFVIVVSSRPSLFLCHFSWGEQLKVSSIQAGIARGSLFLYKRNEGLSGSAKWNKIRQRIKVVVSFRGKRLVLKQISS